MSANGQKCRFLLPPAEEVGAAGKAADAGEGGIGGPGAGGGVGDPLGFGKLGEVDGEIGLPAFGGFHKMRPMSWRMACSRVRLFFEA